MPRRPASSARSAPAAGTESRPGAPYFAGGPLLIAHRGGAALAPENTLLAFERALDWWRADLLELDVQCSRDGEAVVIHDSTVDRTTAAVGRVSAYSRDELRDLDAGHGFTPDGGRSYPFRGRGVGIPTLAEVLERFPAARINVEIKDPRAQPSVMRAVAAAGAGHRVLVAAGRRANRALFASWCGPVSASGEELRTLYVRYVTGRARGRWPLVDALQMPERYFGRQVLSPGFVRAAQERNLAVHVWTVNAEQDMRRLLEWGVDGIITDRPDRLARLLADRAGRPLPPGPPSAGVEPWLERLLRA
jgi:glycerophosphoryl diester phosphodiesterase